MGQITLVFHGRLRDFLHRHPEEDALVFTFSQKIALKHVIEVLSVPHPEVGQILLDGKTVSLDDAV